MRASKLAIAAAAVLAAAPAAAQSGQNSLPTYVQAYEPRTVDERGMWMEADEVERQLRDSPLVIRDEQLNSYVKDVLCRTVGAERCKSVRVYVLEVPAFNATMYANGAMTVWSGLLLRARTEAELASVLGHEFGHFELRHTLAGFKQRRSASDVLAWASVLGGMAGTDTSMLQISLIGSMFRFNREQEQAADLLGLKYLGASNYPARAASDIWQNIMAEADATAIGRKRKPRQRYSAGFFDTHPTELKRALYLRAAAAKMPASGENGAMAYRSAMSKHLPRFLAAQIKLNDFGGTEFLLGQLAAGSGWSGDLLFARGELYRQRGNPRDLVSAAQFYGEAIAAGYSAPDGRRNLGLALLRSGQALEGKTALQQYLKLSPDAADAKAISALVTN
ncbi:M48 family metalloprotease [Sphingomonas sp. GCM10030256]|uniref:M48 family metallopeptidase n=1 Tax=Sphingomonas sp. GCM10030256 TaxID=3273427 RepID=UPI00361B666A